MVACSQEKKLSQEVGGEVPGPSGLQGRLMGTGAEGEAAMNQK